jgi:ergothioneine biosynthesis protein EgtB
MLAEQNTVALRPELLERLNEARRQTDQLFSIVNPEALYDRPIPERHRIIFYIGHLEAFDWNLLHDRLFTLKSFNPGFDRLFAFGIDPVDGGLPSDQPADWPSLREVTQYVAKIRESLDNALSNLDLSKTAPQEGKDFSPSILLNVAIEHRLMHAETLTYMLHQLPLQRKIKRSAQAEVHAPALNPCMVEIPAGAATLGLRRSENIFGWDNEFEQYSVEVPAFSMDRYMVTNGEFLKFVEAGGYENRDFWTSTDWDWRRQQAIGFPSFWRQMDERWFLRTMFDNLPLPLDWPAYVSHAEASAYARWLGKALPTEAQWHRAAYGTPEGKEGTYPWGNDEPTAKLGNFDFDRWDPAPVNAFPEGQSAFGVQGLMGNGWEWTSSIFAPLPGFKPFSFYLGYSADFFDGKHYVMKGGSTRTAASMLRRSFRNWFQSHYQYVYAGFRCVSKSEGDV